MKIITIAGARPQFVKAAVVSRAFSKIDSVKEFIIHTGQHYDENMSDLFFSEMSIPQPYFNLNMNQMQPEELISKMVAGIEKQIDELKADVVLVYGDTYSTLAGATAAKNKMISLVHVEAGLRSFNPEMPEERNRILTDQFSDLLFCPTETAMQNLENEGFANTKKQYLFSGDVMLDAMLFYRKKALSQISDYQELLKEDFALCTFHRFENIENDEKIKTLVESLNSVHKSIAVVCPLHPHTAKRIQSLGLNLGVIVIEPVGYFEMIRLLNSCKIVISDSGGLQKEAFFNKKICVCLREETEWLELYKGGYVLLSGIHREKIEENVLQAFKSNLSFEEKYYGDGTAGDFIALNILNRL